ncbi:unnamed protein product, partial [Coregonus sp. 'balchen']
MTKLQYLNVYLTERLMQAAEEILGVVGDTISEYQEEIARTKRENQYLKRHLITPVLPVNPDCSRTQRENTESVPDVPRDLVRRPEEDTQTHSCTQCGAVFCALSQLEAHMLAHTVPHSGDT